MTDAPPSVGVREQILGSGAGGPLTAPDPWIRYTGYLGYTGGLVLGNPTGGNKGPGALNTQTIYINGSLLNPGLYLLLSGGIMTGVLTLSSDPANPSDAATKNYVDTKDAATSANFANYLPLVGGTLTGNLTMSGSTVITLAADPILSLQAATKQYVDGKFAGMINIPDAPADGTVYGRNNNSWVNVVDLGTY